MRAPEFAEKLAVRDPADIEERAPRKQCPDAKLTFSANGSVPAVALRLTLLACVFLAASQAFAAECVPFSEARHYLGKTRCVTGTIIHVKPGRNGVTFLDFCDDYQVCPFTVIIFANDLRKVGDVTQLQGRSIQIRGKVEEYDGRAEIILRNSEQLGEAASLLPPLSKEPALAPTLPADYDVEHRGHYSAGKFRHPKKAKAAAPKKQGAPVPVDDPGQKP